MLEFSRSLVVAGYLASEPRHLHGFSRVRLEGLTASESAEWIPIVGETTEDLHAL